MNTWSGRFYLFTLITFVGLLLSSPGDAASRTLVAIGVAGMVGSLVAMSVALTIAEARSPDDR